MSGWWLSAIVVILIVALYVLNYLWARAER